MVDEYISPWSTPRAARAVQIPLWSMNTRINVGLDIINTRSDSSMVDEYLTNQYRPSTDLACSDSSMVDEYLLLGNSLATV